MSLYQYCLLFTALLLGGLKQPQATEPDTTVGSYTIRICRNSCFGPADGLYLTGTVVLFKEPIFDNSGHAVHAHHVNGPVNGCFSLTRIHDQDDSYAGIHMQGFMSWRFRASDNVVEFGLYRSPDAGYDVTLKAESNGWVGTGASWGAGAAEIHAPGDIVLTDRVGSPDIRRCPPFPQDYSAG